MTKCKVKAKAFTGIRAHTRWNWANFAMIPSFTGFLCYHGFMLSKTWYYGEKIENKRGGHNLK
jgi:hypothetical protein